MAVRLLVILLAVAYAARINKRVAKKALNREVEAAETVRTADTVKTAKTWTSSCDFTVKSAMAKQQTGQDLEHTCKVPGLYGKCCRLFKKKIGDHSWANHVAFSRQCGKERKHVERVTGTKFRYISR